MMEIKKIGIIGAGSLGVLYANMFTKALGKENVLVLADKKRIDRYKQEGIYFNEEKCDFNYIDAADKNAFPLDFILVCVKFNGLSDSIKSIEPWVDGHTTLASVLNGIRSEEILGSSFSPEQIVWLVPEGMNASKSGNSAHCSKKGQLAIGVPTGYNKERFYSVKALFESIPYYCDYPEDIQLRMWKKLLLNVGINQTCMIENSPNKIVLVPGKPKDEMFAAMQEVVAVANAAGIALNKEDIDFWYNQLHTVFPPDAMPSMLQDRRAQRKSEVELFAGTIRRLGEKYNLPTPVNDMFYNRIKEIESEY